jgi:hypothetical protein
MCSSSICSRRKRKDSTSNWDIKETRKDEENRRALHPSSSLLSFIFLSSIIFFRIRFLVASGLSAYTRTGTIHSRFSISLLSTPFFFKSSSSSSVYLSFSALLSRFRAFPMRCFNLFFFCFFFFAYYASRRNWPVIRYTHLERRWHKAHCCNGSW